MCPIAANIFARQLSPKVVSKRQNLLFTIHRRSVIIISQLIQWHEDASVPERTVSSYLYPTTLFFGGLHGPPSFFDVFVRPFVPMPGGLQSIKSNNAYLPIILKKAHVFSVFFPLKITP